MIVICYVGDLLVFSKDAKEMERFKADLSTVVIIKDLGIPKQFVGMKISWNKNESVGLRRSTLIKKLLVTNGMEKCTATETPMCVETGNDEMNALRDEDEFNSCRSIVGSLSYLSIKTRPDLSVTGSVFGAFVNESTKKIREKPREH